MDSDVRPFPAPPSSTSKDAIPHGPVSLPANATFVSDADEEIFLLYTRLAALKPADSTDAGHFHGLGSENSKEDVLLVRIELEPPPSTTRPASPPIKPEKVDPPHADSRRNRARKGKGSSGKSGIVLGHRDRFGTRWVGGAEPHQALVFEYQLFQDKTALRSRSGDTGSVLWKASIEFLSLVLRQLNFPDLTHGALFDRTKLSQAHILELGAGTGLLALALGPLVRRYTATDTPALVPLLRKNTTLSASRRAAAAAASPSTPTLTTTSTTGAVAAVVALDWTLPPGRQIDIREEEEEEDRPEVLLVVDCVYHPTLVRPLLTTMTALAAPRRTVAIVVVELRAEDVLREFLRGWIALGWSIWSVADDLLGPRWGMWVAWRES